MYHHFALLFLTAIARVSSQVLLNPVARECRGQGFTGNVPEDAPSVPQYVSGQILEAKVDLPMTEGSFEFYLCPEATLDEEECLVRFPLEIVDKGKEFNMAEIQIPGEYEVLLKLPEGITCESCVLKWALTIIQCSSDEDDDQCFAIRNSMCANVTILESPDREIRGFSDFLKGAFGHAVRGAVQHAARCKLGR